MSESKSSPDLVAPPSPQNSATDLSAPSTTETSTSSAAATVVVNDTFELYDLRVEVVCPPGARILCGAKPGDHFVLRGEMLHLPPGQGFSIYSLGALCVVFVVRRLRCGSFALRIVAFGLFDCLAGRFGLRSLAQCEVLLRLPSVRSGSLFLGRAPRTSEAIVLKQNPAISFCRTMQRMAFRCSQFSTRIPCSY